LVGLSDIGVFATSLALGVATRQRGAVHKRFMVLATMSSVAP
jgi:hypothetical protein